MARALSPLLLVPGLFLASALEAACVIDANAEIVNPFEPGCGDVMLRYTEADDTGQNVALGYPVPMPVASLTPVDGFRDYDSLFARHQSLVTLHDEIAGHIVGQSLAGRDIWAYLIGDADTLTPEGASEAAVLVNGGIHAREWQSPEAVTALLEALIERKAESLERYLIDNLTAVLLPVHNVDGFLQTQRHPDLTSAHREQPREGRMRRKNLRHPDTQGAIDAELLSAGDNFFGVDLNRNAAQGFAQANRSRSSATSLVYHGAAPRSEPEILALENAAALAPPSRLRLFSDTHSFSQIHFAPTTGNARRNAITAELSTRVRAASSRLYRYSADPPGSIGIGTMADHFAFTYEIPAWTFELEPLNGGQDYGGLASHGHSGFILPAREAARMRADVTRMYLLGFYRQSGPPAAIAAQIRDRDSGETVFDARWRIATPGTRSLDVATNRALIPGRRYRLWVAFNKPMRVRDASGGVGQYAGQAPGAEIGTVMLNVGAPAAQQIAISSAGSWLGTPGGAPDGYLRYADDAFAADFDVPAGIASEAAPAVLALATRDLAQMQLDADPASVADWSEGHWIGYEDDARVASDSGGTDCSFRPFIATQATADAPSVASTCTVATIVTTPPPAPPRSSGGGSSSAFALLLLTAAACARARRPQRATRDTARSPASCRRAHTE